MDLTQELQNAINVGDVERVRTLLQLKLNPVNLRAAENSHLLWLAIARDQTEIIELLIRAGADLAAEDPYDFGYSVLHDLVRKAENNNERYVQLALLALECGADANARDDEGQSVFQFAVTADSLQLMKALLRHGARENNENIDDILEEVADSENVAEALPLIITLNDPSHELRGRRAITAIIAQLCSPMYNFRAVEECLKMVVDVNQPASDGGTGNTMLVAAARNGRLDAVTALLNRGADINKKTDLGVLPLYAASSSNSSLITKLLIGLGASINDRNDDGKYPIHGACSSRTVENLHLLLSLGASLNVTDENGQYPIHTACSRMCEQIIHFLLSLGTSINVTDINGQTPFSLNRKATLCASNILFIKQFALLQVTSGAVNERDLTIIKANREMFRFYGNCCNELQVMSQTRVFENFNLLGLVASSTTNLSAYLRNAEFAEAIADFIQQHSTQFPIYMKQFRMVLQIARGKRDIMQYTEKVLEQSFPVPVPYPATKKITHYMLVEEFARSELDFYSILYKRISANGRDFISSVMY